MPAEFTLSNYAASLSTTAALAQADTGHGRVEAEVLYARQFSEFNDAIPQERAKALIARAKEQPWIMGSVEVLAEWFLEADRWARDDCDLITYAAAPRR